MTDRGPERVTVRVDTHKEALALARSMLGPYAAVRRRPGGRYQVGHYLRPFVFTKVGEGKDWAEALREAQLWAAQWFEAAARRSLEAEGLGEPPPK